jgi:hypothetical protein
MYELFDDEFDRALDRRGRERMAAGVYFVGVKDA